MQRVEHDQFKKVRFLFGHQSSTTILSINHLINLSTMPRFILQNKAKFSLGDPVELKQKKDERRK